ncbi:hypothetical protein SAMN05720468_1102 [Fibrobacter sp. UWEL]|nr:hypothetical protein SAMN05720468_1102 [Fibrobacter sp. UWEL]
MSKNFWPCASSCLALDGKPSGGIGWVSGNFGAIVAFDAVNEKAAAWCCRFLRYAGGALAVVLAGGLAAGLLQFLGGMAYPVGACGLRACFFDIGHLVI